MSQPCGCVRISLSRRGRQLLQGAAASSRSTRDRYVTEKRACVNTHLMLRPPRLLTSGHDGLPFQT
jgi:hypothetical protein